MKKIAVILCGCGHQDGSEISEVVSTLLAISKLGAQAQCFAPDEEQPTLMNHLTHQNEVGSARNMMIESSRIARGKIKPVTTLKAADFDALIFPGGSGVAKNLCNFASSGSKGIVCGDIQNVIDDFSNSKKPIGAICIAPALLALAFKGEKLELTVGEAGGAAGEIEKLGHRHIVCAPHQVHVDQAHRIVSTPAYMYDDAPLHEIYTGIEMLVSEVILLAGNSLTNK